MLRREGAGTLGYMNQCFDAKERKHQVRETAPVLPSGSQYKRTIERKCEPMLRRESAGTLMRT